MVSLQLEGKLLPSGGLPSVVPRGQPRAARGARWLLRRFYRYQPGAILALFALPVGFAMVLDLFVPPVRDWLDGVSKQHEVGFNLLEHVLVAATVVAAAYYWVLGLKRQRALKSYRTLACKTPDKLVEWSRGEPFFPRQAFSGRLADDIARSRKPAVAVVQGRTGAGRTSFLVELVRELAERR